MIRLQFFSYNTLYIPKSPLCLVFDSMLTIMSRFELGQVIREKWNNGSCADTSCWLSVFSFGLLLILFNNLTILLSE